MEYEAIKVEAFRISFRDGDGYHIAEALDEPEWII